MDSAEPSVDELVDSVILAGAELRYRIERDDAGRLSLTGDGDSARRASDLNRGRTATGADEVPVPIGEYHRLRTDAEGLVGRLCMDDDIEFEPGLLDVEWEVPLL